jgi:ElaB/YqjD/DUF883 family membrane-anchored ribosome-binding protein
MNTKNRYQTPGAVRHDARTLVDDARALLEATKEIADEKVAECRARLTEALEHGQERFTMLREKATQGAKAADEAVREHPYQGMGIAFGIGTLVGFLLGRRN